MGSSGLPAAPGTLAVTYDGGRVVSASLTGPFGSHVADYDDGTVTGEDRKAFMVDPEALRSVLAGAWARSPRPVRSTVTRTAPIASRGSGRRGPTGSGVLDLAGGVRSALC